MNQKGLIKNVLAIIIVILIGAAGYFILTRKVDESKNRDMSLPFNLKLNSTNNERYQLLNSEQIFEISVSAYRLHGKPNELLSSKIEIELPEGITLIEGTLNWQGNLKFYDNDNLFVLRLKGNKEGLNQIKGKLYYLENGEFKLGDIKTFGACISKDLNQAKVFCENYISKLYELPSGPGKLEQSPDGCSNGACAGAFGSCNIGFLEDSNLNGYLGPNIHPLKESDWMHNSDIINQVNILTGGKNITMDKAIAIANWVKQSRPYNYNDSLTPANKLFSVVDIYNENTGICLDSAIITVAMFRIANIPARLAFPTFAFFHARAQAYINNQWITFDSTFDSGPAEVGVKEFPPHVISYFSELKNPSIYRQQLTMQPGEYLGSQAYKQFNIASNNLVFGTVTLAVIPSNSKLYTNDSLFDSGTALPLSFDITRTDDKDLYYAVYNNQVNYVFSFIQPPDVCLNGVCAIYIKMSKNAILMLPRLMFFDGFDNYVPGTQVNSIIDMAGSYRYLETVKLPLGKYKITYYTNLPMSTSDPNVGGQMNIAYADFEVLQGDIVKLISNKFSMASGAKREYYNDVIKRLNDTWTNCINNPQI